MIGVWIKISERLNDRSDMWIDPVTDGLKDVLQLTHRDEVAHVDLRHLLPRCESACEPFVILPHDFELLDEPTIQAGIKWSRSASIIARADASSARFRATSSSWPAPMFPSAERCFAAASSMCQSPPSSVDGPPGFSQSPKPFGPFRRVFISRIGFHAHDPRIRCPAALRDGPPATFVHPRSCALSAIASEHFSSLHRGHHRCLSMRHNRRRISHEVRTRMAGPLVTNRKISQISDRVVSSKSGEWLSGRSMFYDRDSGP